MHVFFVFIFEVLEFLFFSPYSSRDILIYVYD